MHLCTRTCECVLLNIHSFFLEDKEEPRFRYSEVTFSTELSELTIWHGNMPANDAFPAWATSEPDGLAHKVMVLVFGSNHRHLNKEDLGIGPRRPHKALVDWICVNYLFVATAVNGLQTFWQQQTTCHLYILMLGWKIIVWTFHIELWIIHFIKTIWNGDLKMSLFTNESQPPLCRYLWTGIVL